MPLKKLYQTKIKVLFFLLLPLFMYADNTFLDIDITLSKDTDNSDSSINISIKNTHKKNIYILKRDIDIDNNIFSVKLYGKEIPYIGRVIKKNSNLNYITMEPGEIHTFKVILSKYYKMNKEGNYSIQYKMGNHIGIRGKSNIIPAEIKNSNVLYFNFFPAVSNIYNNSIKKKSNYNQCSEIEIRTIEEATQQALIISQNAAKSINSTQEFIKSERYNTWFGTTTNADGYIVKNSLNNIANTLKNENINFDCSCTEPYFAYIHLNEPYNIYLCNGFWSLQIDGIDSQSGTIIHQLSHFDKVASAQNYSYGEEDTKNLAILYPHYAIYNADSYEYFVENTPYLSMDDIFSSAQSIHVLNQFTQLYTLNNLSVKNMFKITVGKTGLYSFFTTGKLDTQGTLYNSNNLTLKFNDDTTFDNLNFSFSNYLKKGNIYYLKVNTYEGRLGSYVLNIQIKNKLDFLIPVLDLNNF